VFEQVSRLVVDLERVLVVEEIEVEVDWFGQTRQCITIGYDCLHFIAALIASRGDGLAPSQWGTPAWPVIRTVFSVAAFRFDPPTVASQLEAESTQRRIRAIEAQASSSTADAELFQAWAADLVQLERTQRRTAELEAENGRLQTELNALPPRDAGSARPRPS
jgi:hypothetical protein